MDVQPPTVAEVAETAVHIYQNNVIGNNLVGKAEEAVLGVESLCGKVTTTTQSVVSCVRAILWLISSYCG